MSRIRRTSIRRLEVVPVSYRTACAFLRTHHRHHRPPQGHTFSIGLITADATLVAVAMIGRPAAGHLDDGHTAELTRLCTNTSTHCSELLAAAWRTARAMGYHCMITYTRGDEPGASLRAAGWRRIAARPATLGRDRPGRPRQRTGVEHTTRVLWQVCLAGTGRRRIRRVVASSTSAELDGRNRCAHNGRYGDGAP